jgi:hypothetical protein
VDNAARPRLFRRSGRAAAAALAAVLVTASLAAACNLYTTLDLKRGPDDYNIADWELRHLPEKWLFLFGQVLRGEPSAEAQDQNLRRFFALTPRIEQLERRISDAEQRGAAPLAADRDELAALLDERDAIENQAEATIEARLSKVAADAGLTRTFLDIVWPPIDTEFTQSPYTLVTSPRDRILLLGSDLLRGDLTLAEVEAIEAGAEARGDISALAFPTGGIGAYPTIVDYPADYRRALAIVAHEWMHNYLFFTPLGFNYYASNDLRTINETVADLVGHELAEAVIARWPLDAPASASTPPAVARDELRFDIGAALRALRVEVDALLEQGRIAEAEALMEQRRQEFATQGYYFRKLNQAYFAFTNLYAGRAGDPSATNPIGPKVDELRRRSANLREFVDRVSGVTSVADLDRLLEELAAN